MLTLRPRSILIGLMLLLLAGCGQKGPLYLPKPSADQASWASWTAFNRGR